MDTLNSNIIIATNVKSPNREGFRKIHESLNSIKDKLNALTKQPWLIHMQLRFASKEVRKAFSDLQKAASSQQLNVPSRLPVAQPLKEPVGTRVRRTTTPGEEEDTVRVLTEAQSIHKGIQSTVRQTTDQMGSMVKLEEENVDIASKARVQYERTLETRKAMFNILQSENRGKRDGEFLDKKIESKLLSRRRIYANTANEVRKLTQQGFSGGGGIFKEKVISSSLTGEFVRVRDLIKEYTKDLDNGYESVKKVNFATGQITQSVRKTTEEVEKQKAARKEISATLRAQEKQDALIAKHHKTEVLRQKELAAIYSQNQQKRSRAAALESRLQQDRNTTFQRSRSAPTVREFDPNINAYKDLNGEVRTYVRELRNGWSRTIQINTVTGEVTTALTRSVKQAREQSKADAETARQKRRQLSAQEKLDRLLAKEHVRVQKLKSDYNEIIAKRQQQHSLEQRLSASPNASPLRAREVSAQLPNPATGQYEKQVGVLRTWVENLQNGHELVYQVNTLTGETTRSIRQDAEYVRRANQARKEQAKFVENIRKDHDKYLRGLKISQQLEDLRSKGAVTTSRRFVLNDLGQLEENVRLVRYLGGGFRDFTVEVTKANAASGQLEQTVLKGSDAMRAYGDSFFVGAQKVALWLGITSAAFAAMRTFQYGTEVITELNKNTILLARVLDSTGDGFVQAEKKARRLTEQIGNITETIGGSVVEAQKASIVFARAFKDEETILQGVTASLLAARIAELDVAEAAELLAAATLQFKIRGDELISTLDGLNTLSNSYRVTTQDLLDAVSRAGSVYAEHGGQLESLAAITAVVSQVTGRTGSQIGNALKTVISRLDRLEVQKKIFEELGLSINSADGSSHDFLATLIELEAAMSTINNTVRRELELSQAGTRQRNILSSATSNVEEAIRAYIKASKDSQSSTEELIQQTGTLDAAFSRLQATFENALAGSADSIASILQVFADLARAIVSVNQATDGWLFTGGAAVAAFILIHASLAKIIPATASYISLLRQVAVDSYRTAQANIHLARSYSLATVASRDANLAAAQYQQSGTRTHATALLASAAIIGVSWALSQQSREMQKAAIETERVNSASTAQIAAAEKRIRTITNVGKALVRLRIQEKLARESGDDRRAAAFGERANFLQREAIEIGADFAPARSVEDIGDIAIRATQKERRAIIEARKNIILQKSNEATSLRSRIQYNKEMQQQYEAHGAYQGAFGSIPFLTPERGASILKWYSDFFHSNDELKAKLKEVESSIEKERAELAGLTTELANTTKEEERAARAIKGIRDALEDWRDVESRLKQENFANTVTGREQSIASLKRTATEASNTVRRLYENFSTLEISSPALADEYRKQMASIVDEADKANQELQKRRFATGKDYYASSIERDAEVRKKTAETLLKANRRFDGKSSAYDEVAQLRQRRKQIYVELQKARERQKEIALTGGDPRESEALREHSADLLAELRDRELSHANELLKVDAQIAVERKKQADEAQRALGVLSEEDKLRFRAQASYFARNPDAQIGFDQQFLAGANDNRIAQQFFEGRLQTFGGAIRQGNPYARSLEEAGFGISTDLRRSIRERERFGTVSDADRQEALERADAYDRQRMQLLNGEDPIQGYARFGADVGVNGAGRERGNVSDINNITFDFSGLDLQPFVDTLKEGFESAIQAEADRIRNEFNELDDVRRASRPRRVSN